MHHYKFAIERSVDVNLQDVDAEFKGPLTTIDCFLRPLTTATAMCDHFWCVLRLLKEGSIPSDW
jgi:hypothetical protein